MLFWVDFDLVYFFSFDSMLHVFVVVVVIVTAVATIFSSFVFHRS